MSITVRIPSALRSKTGGLARIEVEARTVAQALRGLEDRFVGFARDLRDAQGNLRPRVNVYVNDVHIRFLRGLDTPLQDGDQVYVVSIIMGG